MQQTAQATDSNPVPAPVQATKPTAKTANGLAKVNGKAKPTKKAAAKKVAKAKKAKAGGFQDNQKITVLAKENPRREGSLAYQRFASFKTGQTVGRYLASIKKKELGSALGAIRRNLREKHISVK